MFRVKADGAMELSIGDTASFSVHVTGYTFGPSDRAIVAIKDMAGNTIFEKYYAVSDEEFTAAFANADTDQLEEGDYSYDIRFVINPRYTGQKITDGDQVLTPKPPLPFRLVRTIGEV